MTSAPRRARPSITLATAHSLPGMACELSTTTSPSSMCSQRLSPEAICASADIGSPWEPVEMTQISPGLWSPIVSMSAKERSGIVSMPSSRAMPTFFTIERPSRATLRPLAMAASASCWMRCTWLAKQATTMRRPRWAKKILRSDSPTGLSLPV